MSRKTTSASKHAHIEDSVKRPSVSKLAMYILKAPVNSGMIWLVIPALAAMAYLYHNHYENDIVLALLFSSLVITALVRGCRDWQHDLNEYQHHLALERHREQGKPTSSFTRSFPSRR